MGYEVSTAEIDNLEDELLRKRRKYLLERGWTVTGDQWEFWEKGRWHSLDDVEAFMCQVHGFS